MVSSKLIKVNQKEINRPNKMIEALFILTFLSTVFAYLPQVISAAIHNVPIMTAVSYYDTGINSALANFRNLKELLVIIALAVVCLNLLKKNRARMFVVLISVFIILIALGTGSLLFSDKFSVWMVLAGIRGMLFFLVSLLFGKYFINKYFVKKFHNILKVTLIIELIVVLIQMYIIKSNLGYFSLGQFRLLGTFGHTGGFAAYIIGYGMYLYVIKFYFRLVKNKQYLFEMFCLLALSICTGTRMIIILFLLLIMTSIFMFINKTNKKSNKLELAIMVLFPFALLYFLKISESIANRGSAVEANLTGGRIFVIIDYLTKSTPKELLIGTGIGYGTNSGVILNRELNMSDVQSRIMDGTFNTLITQYGLVIFTIIFMVVIFTYLNLINKSRDRPLFVCVFIITNVLLFINTNIFEQYSLTLLLVLSTTLMFSDIIPEPIIQSKEQPNVQLMHREFNQ
ncbi:hypothetical protein [Paenibacillus glycanilyticus]|uniref:hypothetical protein n=1 Tax=Paenibacillus glycanilyticus TaxID=126569 RepID=UPI003EC02BC2